MLIPTTMVDMVDMDMVVAMVDMVDMVWDTDPLDTMASVRLELSPSLMLIPTTMVDMVDMDMVVAMVDMVVMVLDTGPMDSMVVKEKALKQGSTHPNKCDFSDKSNINKHFSPS